MRRLMHGLEYDEDARPGLGMEGGGEIIEF